jgi:cytochrome c-type biogenesis protein CcmH
MNLFLILAAVLVVAVLLALAWPLLRPPAPSAVRAEASNLRLLREQLAELDAELAAGTLDADQHAVARAELQRRVLEETREAEVAVQARPGRASVLVLALAVPALAAGLYARLGNPEGLRADAPPHASAADIEALVQRLADRMRAQPEDPNGWALLGRAYAGLQRWNESAQAFVEAVKRSPPDPQLLADYADVLAMSQGQKLAGEPEKLALRALALDPDHLKALALAGSAAFERGDALAALKHWERAKALAPAGSPFAEGLDGSIAEARAAAGVSAPTPAAAQTAAPAPQAAASAAPLRVSVRLAPALAGAVPPGATLFVFARAVEGPRMPLAIVRQPADAGPVQVQLDDSSAMSPALRLSSQQRVVVTARISASGSATPQAGDLEGQSGPVDSSGFVELLIDKKRD